MGSFGSLRFAAAAAIFCGKFIICPSVMPLAALVLREPATTSLSQLVEKAQSHSQKLTSRDYNLQVTSQSFDLSAIYRPTTTTTPQTDEGFESDIDNLSIVSSDDSFVNNKEVVTETDSANGSASSDSDNEMPVAPLAPQNRTESYPLVDCVCYTDVTHPDVLIFVIKNETLVFRFEVIPELKSFYSSFTTYKAIAASQAYKTETKFNLLQRTDQNGVTHIEITRDKLSKASSSDDLLNLHDDSLVKEQEAAPEFLRKVWNSAESLLEAAPKRPERRKKKSKAPPPPITDVYSGQYVRVNVNFDHKTDFNRLIIKSQANEPHPKKIQNFNLNFLKPKPVLKVTAGAGAAEPPPMRGSLGRGVTISSQSWTNSVPRLLRKPRSRSETRNFQPMAYRYIDTTQPIPVAYSAVQPTIPRLTANIMPNYANGGLHNETLFSNRLFGLSSKLKEFEGGAGSPAPRWTTSSPTPKLKSVIKKDDQKKKEKKVTFSAYTTVQVV